MDLTPQHGFLEELLQAPRRSDSWAPFPAEATEQFFSNGWNFDSFDESTSLATSNPSFAAFSTASEPSFQSPFGDPTYPFVDSFTVPEIDYPSMLEDEELGLLSNNHSFEETNSGCKVEIEEQGCIAQDLNIEKKAKAKKLEGQPSKNLMAERRRRKRLNDRLTMLRSIVPKISKMDRTSILGDTIDYMKELLERINNLQDGSEEGPDQIKLVTKLKELKPNQALARNSPKFQAERREMDTQIDISCATRPGLLLSTVNTLEALGLELQQCVVSCFNDFSMQASCSEVAEQRALVSSEDIKQALFRTAGYGGRFL